MAMSRFKLEDYTSLTTFLGDDYLDLKAGKKQRDLYKICEELNIALFSVRFKDDSLSGVLHKDDDKWSILINETDSPRRKMFTIAHELGHYFSLKDGKLSKDLFDESGFHEDRAIFTRPTDTESLSASAEKAEAEANFIAANLLMPEKLVKASFEGKKNIEEMAEEFGVSESAMGFRLLNLGLTPIESIGVADGGN